MAMKHFRTQLPCFRDKNFLQVGQMHCFLANQVKQIQSIFFLRTIYRTEDSGGVSKVIHDNLFLHSNLQTGIPKLLYSTRRSGLLQRHRSLFSYFPYLPDQRLPTRFLRFEISTTFMRRILLAKIARSSSKVSVRYTALFRNLCFRENYREAGRFLLYLS